MTTVEEYNYILKNAEERLRYRVANWLAHGYEFEKVTGVLLKGEERTILVDQAGFDYGVDTDHVTFYNPSVVQRNKELKEVLDKLMSSPHTRQHPDTVVLEVSQEYIDAAITLLQEIK